MKRLKKLFVSFMAVVMMCVCAFSLTGCIEDIKKLELNVQIYNYDEQVVEDYTMSIDLYRHLAPETVDAIVEYVNDEYYNGAVFYKQEGYNSQIMLGDLIDKNGVLEANALKPQIEKGEFEKGGTVGSNLTSKKGSIGLWRSWFAQDNSYSNNSNATDSGRATWFIPTESISAYTGNFCVFAQFDTEAENNSDTLTALNKAFESADNYDKYVIYYTGEYNDQTPDAEDGYGLTMHIVESSEFDQANIADLFEAEGAQLVSYNYRTVNVPVTASGAIGAKIVSAKII